MQLKHVEVKCKILSLTCWYCIINAVCCIG